MAPDDSHDRYDQADHRSAEGPGLDESVRQGTRWMIVAQLASQLVSFVVLAALYRLVQPEQFGLLGMAVPLLLLARIFAAFGLNVATVQKRQLTRGQLSTVFWASLLVSSGVAGLVALCGPLLAHLYQAPSLAPVVAGLAGTLVIAALGAQHQALLERKLQIRRVATARLAGQIAGALAAVAAGFAQWGVWALVVQQYVELSLLAVLLWQCEPWRPGRWRGWRSANDLLSFGGFYSLSSLMFFAAQNVDKVLIAWWIGGSSSGQAALGLYSQAFNLMMKPVYLVTTPITGIMLPALARVAHRPEQFESLAVRFYRMIAIALFPGGVGLSIVAVDLMLLLGGNSWRPAGILLTLLAPTILSQGPFNISGSLLAAQGRSRLLLLGASATALIMTTALLIAMWQGGWSREASLPVSTLGPTRIMAVAYTATSLLIFGIPYLSFCFRAVGVSLSRVLRALSAPAAYAALMGLIAGAAQRLGDGLQWPAPGRLAVTVTVGVVIYTMLARRELQWFWAQLRPPRLSGVGADPPGKA